MLPDSNGMEIKAITCTKLENDSAHKQANFDLYIYAKALSISDAVRGYRPN